MKKIALLCLFLAAIPARADVIMVQNVEETLNTAGQVSSQTATITTKIKGDKSRTDIARQAADPADSSKTSIIADAASGEIITLVHESKSFMKFSPDKAKGLVDEIQKSKAIATPKIIDTGRTEKVGDYNTKVYTVQSGAAKYTFWITKDFPDFANLQQQMRKFQLQQLDLKRKLGMNDNLSPDVWTLDGMAVKTEILSDKGTTTMTLVTARNQAIPDTDFQPPSDYTEMEPPQQPVKNP